MAWLRFFHLITFWKLKTMPTIVPGSFSYHLRQERERIIWILQLDSIPTAWIERGLPEQQARALSIKPLPLLLAYYRCCLGYQNPELLCSRATPRLHICDPDGDFYKYFQRSVSRACINWDYQIGKGKWTFKLLWLVDFQGRFGPDMSNWDAVPWLQRSANFLTL